MRILARLDVHDDRFCYWTGDNFLQESVAQFTLGAKRPRVRRECLLGLRVECWVLNLGVDEEPQVLLNLRLLYFELLMLLCDGCKDFVNDLICDELDVRSTARRIYRVDEANLLELARF